MLKGVSGCHGKLDSLTGMLTVGENISQAVRTKCGEDRPSRLLGCGYGPVGRRPCQHMLTDPAEQGCRCVVSKRPGFTHGGITEAAHSAGLFHFADEPWKEAARFFIAGSLVTVISASDTGEKVFGIWLLCAGSPCDRLADRVVTHHGLFNLRSTRVGTFGDWAVIWPGQLANVRMEDFGQTSKHGVAVDAALSSFHLGKPGF